MTLIMSGSTHAASIKAAAPNCLKPQTLCTAGTKNPRFASRTSRISLLPKALPQDLGIADGLLEDGRYKS